MWNRFSGGKDQVVKWYRSVHSRLTELEFAEPIMEELNYVASMIESAAHTNDAQL